MIRVRPATSLRGANSYLQACEGMPPARGRTKGSRGVRVDKPYLQIAGLSPLTEKDLLQVNKRSRLGGAFLP